MATTTESVPIVAAAAETPAGQQPAHKEPLKLSGALDQFDSFDVTPVIGKEFPHASLKEWLEAPNSDDLIRDLAITSKLSLFLPSNALLT